MQQLGQRGGLISEPDALLGRVSVDVVDAHRSRWYRGDSAKGGCHETAGAFALRSTWRGSTA
jgi:hypothetical protein